MREQYIFGNGHVHPFYPGCPWAKRGKNGKEASVLKLDPRICPI
jgi:hypothetical protein